MKLGPPYDAKSGGPSDGAAIIVKRKKSFDGNGLVGKFCNQKAHKFEFCHGTLLRSIEIY